MAAMFHLSATGTFTLQTQSGATLKTVIVGKAGDSTAKVTLYDSPDTSGAELAVVGAAAAGSLDFGIELADGLTAVVAGSSAPDVTVVIE